MLWLRALEPADAPVSVGLKLALAIGTARRIEHDEADQVFVYTHPEGADVGDSNNGAGVPDAAGKSEVTAGPGSGNGGGQQSKSKEDNRSSEVQVYVREKVRVESADPSLLSLSAKLTALTNTLEMARDNLAAVMGVDVEK